LASVRELKDQLIEQQLELSQALAKVQKATENLEQGQRVQPLDSVQYAMELGRLDFLSAVLASLAIAISLAGVIGYVEIRRKAAKEARQESQTATTQFLSTNGVELLKECLQDPQVVASLQVQLEKLGLDDTDTANADEFDGEDDEPVPD